MAKRLFSLVAKVMILVMLAGVIQCQVHGKMRVTRGSGSMGLIPFPRVGRSGPYDRNLGDLNLFDTPEILHQMKRHLGANLNAFPRYGRADWRGEETNHNSGEWTQQKKNIAIAVPNDMTKCIDNCAKQHSLGLWWGPRLGRVQKRAAFEMSDYPWALISLRDIHLSNPRETDFTPRLGRESEEDVLEEGEDNAISSTTHLGRPVQPLQ